MLYVQFSNSNSMISPFSPGYRDRARASGPIEKGPGLDGLEPTWHQESALKRLQKNNPKTAQDKYPWCWGIVQNGLCSLTARQYQRSWEDSTDKCGDAPCGCSPKSPLNFGVPLLHSYFWRTSYLLEKLSIYNYMYTYVLYIYIEGFLEWGMPKMDGL